MAEQADKMTEIISLCKRRGFIFPTAEVYGGLAGFWDFGPLGVELKNNIKRSWWRRFVQQIENIVGLDSVIITNPKVWEKSGHTSGFADELVECKKCHHRFKADDVSKKCPDCGGGLTASRKFNTMFKTFVGPVEDSAAIAYLRPETAQNIFVNFENVRQAMRLKLPFGIAQIGKAFRNEITPGNFIFRTREFEQMEIEFFIEPKEDKKWFNCWVAESKKWFLDLGIKKENLKERKQDKKELAHYAKETVDLEYNFSFEKNWHELLGIANRGDYDLKQHGLAYKDENNKEFYPYVIEPSFGVERAALAFLLESYEEIEGGRTTTTESIKEKEIILHLHKDLAPIKAAILPLAKKPDLQKLAKEIVADLNKDLMVQYDETGSIGKRYRRQDEIGTPYCITVDFESLADKKVTVRDRDTMAQERVDISELREYFKDKFDTL